MRLAPKKRYSPNTTKIKGFALITELISLLVFGLGVLALSSLSERTITSSSESLQKIHATWLANSLISKLTMNSEDARNLQYNQNNISCDSTPQNRTKADLAAIFCISDLQKATWSQTKPIDVMGDLDWTITCEDSDSSDSIPCSKNSVFIVNIDWDAPNGNKQTGKNSVSYEFFF